MPDASAARRQVELGVLERLLDRRNAGGVARLALLDGGLGVDVLRLLSRLELWSRYCWYLATSALQYAASLDWANAVAGSDNSAAASRILVNVFMIFSIAR